MIGMNNDALRLVRHAVRKQRIQTASGLIIALLDLLRRELLLTLARIVTVGCIGSAELGKVGIAHIRLLNLLIANDDSTVPPERFAQGGNASRGMLRQDGR
jgi:hypothetical protein